MNTIVTSKEAILKASKEIAALHGFQSLNMRDVARHCNVAVGSVYNYFPSKADLVTATVEDIWKDVFHEVRVTDNSNNFTDSVEWLFETVSSGVKEYPAFFTVHPMGFSNDDKEKGREAMIRNFGHIKNNLLSSLKNDSNVKLGTFNENFTPENFVNFVFSNVLTLLISKEQSSYMLTEVIKRTIY